MTTIDQQTVRKVAKLSRLELDEKQIHDFARQLGSVLDYMNKLNELDLCDVEPMAHAIDLRNVLRPDQPGGSLSVDEVLANAPSQAPPFFRVPKVLGDGSGA